MSKSSACLGHPDEIRVDVSGLMLNQALRAKDLPMDAPRSN